eukprot:2584166-Pleurochrysis_carterae.AAC.1
MPTESHTMTLPSSWACRIPICNCKLQCPVIFGVRTSHRPQGQAHLCRKQFPYVCTCKTARALSLLCDGYCC